MLKMTAMFLLLASAAQAENLTMLQRPANYLGNGTAHCAGLGFDSSDNISGYCSSYTDVCESRVCKYTYSVLAARWDEHGVLLASVPCGTAVKAGAQPTAWTYSAGYAADNCQIPPTSEPTNVLRVGPNGYQWYGYVTTSVDGAFELLLSGQQGSVGAF